jgi:hypothetical protein
MRHREVIKKKTGERIVMFEDSDFEYENPVKHYADYFIVSRMILRGVPNEELIGQGNKSENSRQIFQEAASDWEEMLYKYKSIKVPENLIQLFDSNKKSEQEALLKEVALTPELLMGLLIKAEEIGYTLSQYTSEYSQKGLDLSKMPFAFEVKEDGEVEVFGKTELSVGQMKQALKHRNIKIAKILDKGDNWHCFFATYKSLYGDETWQGENQPHFHYISSSYGLDRAEVVAQIKSEKYKLGKSLHVKLEKYGNQPDKR